LMSAWMMMFLLKPMPFLPFRRCLPSQPRGSPRARRPRGARQRSQERSGHHLVLIHIARRAGMNLRAAVRCQVPARSGPTAGNPGASSAHTASTMAWLRPAFGNAASVPSGKLPITGMRSGRLRSCWACRPRRCQRPAQGFAAAGIGEPLLSVAMSSPCHLAADRQAPRARYRPARGDVPRGRSDRYLVPPGRHLPVRGGDGPVGEKSRLVGARKTCSTYS
jgi:hypothetical protein